MAKPKRISDHVYLIGDSSLSGPDDCCIYLVDVGDGGFVLIDAGLGRAHKRLMKNIRKLGFDPSDMKALMLTHGHIDHIGGAAAIKREFNPMVIAHADDKDAIEGRRPERTAADWYSVSYAPVEVDEVITGDSERTIGAIVFRFIHTPGHTPGSISVLIEDNGTSVIFAQDVHGPFDESFGSDISQWRVSMGRLIDLNADILCEGHYGIYQPAERARDYIMGYLKRFA